jgi:hypothetical protein
MRTPPCRTAFRTPFFCLVITRYICSSRAFHYEQPPCKPDEVQAEVLGGSGYTCSPKCDETSYSCPVDVPLGVTAQSQCILQALDKISYCGLTCQVDSQCPTNAKCTQMGQVGIGLCMFAASFSDWARSVTTKKLAIGWPQKGGSIASLQVTKTLTAIQNLKVKYRIDDADADLASLKELVNSVSSPSPPAAVSAIPVVGGAGPSPRSDLNIWESDLSRLGNEASHGLSGLESEFNRDLYLAEHLDQRYAASDLFRTVVIFFVIYLAAGSFVKYQTTGASGINMIPHIGFWSEYPALVVDGITYSKMLIDGALGKSPRPYDSLDLSGGLDGHIRGVSIGRAGGAGAFEAL